MRRPKYGHRIQDGEIALAPGEVRCLDRDVAKVQATGFAH